MIRRQALLALALLLAFAAPAGAAEVSEGGSVPSVLAPVDETTEPEDYIYVPAESRTDTVDDSIHEEHETFMVDGVRVTILDNDTPPIELVSASVAEDAGPARVLVRTAEPVKRNITIGYGTTSGSADGDEYDGRPGMVTIEQGRSEATISIPLAGDTTDEDDETFTVEAAGQQATVTIVNDDLRALSVGDAVVLEGDGANTVLRVPLTIDAPTFRPVTVTFGTEDGTARGPADFLARLGTVTIPPGQVSATIDLAVVSDDLLEGPEMFAVTLVRPRNATIARGTAVLTIDDDDALPVTDARLTPVGLGAPRLRGGRLTVRVRCPRGEVRCRGRLRLYADADRRSPVALLRRERRLGSARFSIAGGRSRAVRVRLSTATAAAARRAGRLRLSAYTVTRDAVGNVDTNERSATLRVRR